MSKSQHTKSFSKRLKNELALLRSKEALESILHNLEDVYYRVDAEGIVLYVTPSIRKLLGYEVEEVIGTPMERYYLDPSLRKKVIEEILKNPEQSDPIEIAFKRKDGSGGWASVYTHPWFYPDGSLGGFDGLVRDISLQKELQQKMMEQEAKYRGIFDASPIGIVYFDPDGTVTDCNPKAIEIFGSSYEVLVGMNLFRDIKDPDLITAVKQMYREGEGYYEGYYTSVSGFKTTYLRIHLKAITDSEGRLIAGMGLGEDITRQQKAFEALASSEARLNEAQKIAHIGSWELDLVHNKLWWSAEIYNIFEIDRNRFRATYEAFLNAVHPEDREMVDKAYRHSLQTRTPYDIIHRLKMADGRIKYVREVCTTYYDGDRPIRSVGTIQDMTQLHRSRIKLQEREKFLDAIITHIPHLLFVKDVETFRYLRVNRAVAELFGKDPEYFIGKRDEDIFSRQETEALISRDEEVLIKNGVVDIPEIVIDTQKEGRRVYRTKKIPVGDEQGSPRYILSLAEDITLLKNQQAQLRHQALHDPLTDTPNRLMLNATLEHAILHAKREQYKIALLFLDLDNFKKINDTAGHIVGDKILKACVLRIRSAFRAEDLLSRFGGDEFVMVLEQILTAEDAAKQAKKLLALFDAPFTIDHHHYYLTLSIGIALFPDDGEDPDFLIKAADTAMYRSKNEGKNRYMFYTPHFTNELVTEIALENSLRDSIQQGHFTLHYQLQYALESSDIVGLEALLRWYHPQLGFIAPDRFIPIAEKSGLILPLGEWVLKEACRQAGIWMKSGLMKGKRVSINISGLQLESENFVTLLRRTLKESALDPVHLELEITESVLMGSPLQWTDTLARIKDLGVSIAIDDFGTGYSSLSYLRQFPLDCLKIDKSFVDDIPKDSDAYSIVKAIIALANSLGLSTIAEGIETEEQAFTLRQLGCHYAQGYLFAKPIPAQEAKLHLQKKMVEKEKEK